MNSKDESLYHYTDIGAVASIIKNRKLWLTNVGYLNDSEEMLEGVRCLVEQYEKLDLGDKPPPEKAFASGFLAGVLGSLSYQENDLSIFTCSFSRAPNLLSQWRAYGNFAIEFSRKEIEKKHKLYDCIYSKMKKNKEAKRLISEVLNGFPDVATQRVTSDLSQAPIEKLTVGAGTFKNKHFEAEHEVRLLYSGSYTLPVVNHRARGDCLIPYVEMDVSVESILAIHVGPISNQPLAERSLKSLLRACGNISVPIVMSDIPYRS